MGKLSLRSQPLSRSTSEPVRPSVVEEEYRQPTPTAIFKDKLFFVPKKLMDPNHFFFIAQTIVFHGGEVVPEPHRLVDYVVFDFNQETSCATSNATIKDYRIRLPLVPTHWIEGSVKDGEPLEVEDADLSLWEVEIQANTAHILLQKFVTLTSKLCPFANPYQCIDHVQPEIRPNSAPAQAPVHYGLPPPFPVKPFKILPVVQTPPEVHTPSETPPPGPPPSPPPGFAPLHVAPPPGWFTINYARDNGNTASPAELIRRSEQNTQEPAQLQTSAPSSSFSSCSTPVPANNTPTPTHSQAHEARDTPLETIHTSYDTATSSEFESIVNEPHPLRSHPWSSTPQRQYNGLGLGHPMSPLAALEALPEAETDAGNSEEDLGAYFEEGNEVEPRADLGDDTVSEGTATPIGANTPLANIVGQLEEYVATYPNAPQRATVPLPPVPIITVTEPEESVEPEEPIVPTPPGPVEEPEQSEAPKSVISSSRQSKKEKRAAAKAAKIARRAAGAAKAAAATDVTAAAHSESARSTPTLFSPSDGSGCCPTCGHGSQYFPPVTELESDTGTPTPSDTLPSVSNPPSSSNVATGVVGNGEPSPDASSISTSVASLITTPSSAPPIATPVDASNYDSSTDTENLEDSSPPSYSEAPSAQDQTAAPDEKEAKTKVQKRNRTRRMKEKRQLKAIKQVKAREEETQKALQRQKEKEEKQAQRRQRAEGLDYSVLFQISPQHKAAGYGEESASKSSCNCIDKVVRHARSLRPVCDCLQRVLQDMLCSEESWNKVPQNQEKKRPCGLGLGLRLPTRSSVIKLFDTGQATPDIVDAYMAALDLSTHHYIAVGNTYYFESLFDKECFSNDIPSPISFETCHRFVFPMLFDSDWYACMADPKKTTLTLYDPACRSWTAPHNIEPLLRMIAKNLFSYLKDPVPIKMSVIASPVRVDRALSALLVTHACELFAFSGPDESAHTAVEALGPLLTSNGTSESIKNTMEDQLQGRIHNKNCDHRFEMFPVPQGEAPTLADQHPLSMYVENKLGKDMHNSLADNKPENSFRVPPPHDKHFIPPHVITSIMAERLITRLGWTASTGHLA